MIGAATMISSPLLTEIHGSVGGRWVGARSGRTFPVINPATGERLGQVPDMDEYDAVAAVDAAAESMTQTSTLTQRREWLTAVAELLDDHVKDLARIITTEQGKPLREGAAEVAYAAGFFRFYARHLDQLEPRMLPEVIRNCRWTVYYRPAGVAALITPWNFPLAMLAKKLSAAIAGGCSVVARPASQTPLTTIALWNLVREIPALAERLNLVTGASGPIGHVFCTHPAVRVVSFTGSTEVGKVLMRQAAGTVKRVTMELGGNAPFIVFEDADLPATADALVANKFRAGGQTCVCANRVFVHQRVMNAFVEVLESRVRQLRVGNGLDEGVDIGPLIDRRAFDKVSLHVRNGIDAGAIRVCGEDPPRPTQDWGCFYPPTILTNVQENMLLCQEETFGPVVGISGFSTEQDVVERANATPYGLAAYVFTANGALAERVAAALRFGHVGVNTGSGPTPEAPFGGMKESGLGREGGIEGLHEFCEVQAVASA